MRLGLQLQLGTVLRERRVRDPPPDVGVLGVDNDEMLCELSDPPLSSIAMDIERGGYDTAKLLHKMIKGLKKPYDILVKPTQVITRQSTDIYATNDAHIASTLKFIHKKSPFEINQKGFLLFLLTYLYHLAIG